MARPPKRPRDMNELAVHIGRIATHEIDEAKSDVVDLGEVEGAVVTKPAPPPKKKAAKKR